MKRQNLRISVLVFFLITLFFFGCKKSEDRFENTLLLNTDYLVVAHNSNTHSFDLLANQAVSLSSDVDWISFDTTELAKGKHLVHFTTTANEEDERSGIITIQTGPEMVREILILQEAGLVNVFYVKPAGSGSGRSWLDASDLTTALKNASSGSVIHLSEGMYVPNQTITNGEPSNPGDNTFEIRQNIHLIGGYPANANTGASADPQLYKTIFSGKQADGAESFHVVSISAPAAEGEKVQLEGITVKQGHATDRGINITINGKEFSRGNGGGMVIGGSNVLLKNVSIVDNQASAKSGLAGQSAGLYIFGNARVEMRDCIVSNNSNAGSNGGGLWVSESKAFVFNSEISDNYSKGTASGVHAFPHAEVYLYHSKVQNNSNSSFGAGVYARQSSKVFLVNCLVTGNASTSANGGGGVMLYDGSSADIISSTISANSTAGPGGGVFRRQNTNKLTLSNSIVSGNTQVSTSSDVDAFELTAEAPIVKGSVLSSKAYDSFGVEMSEAFKPALMFSSEFHLLEGNNPALMYGMDAQVLQLISQGYTPALEGTIVKDINGLNRDKPIMGAITQ